MGTALGQGSALNTLPFAVVLNRLIDDCRQLYVVRVGSRFLESWRHAQERRGMKFSNSKPEYLCGNEREGSSRGSEGG